MLFTQVSYWLSHLKEVVLTRALAAYILSWNCLWCFLEPGSAPSQVLSKMEFFLKMESDLFFITSSFLCLQEPSHGSQLCSS